MQRDFHWLWASYAVSTAGTRLALDAFPLVAVLVLHSGTAEVAVLAAVGLAVGALVAAPLGPWVEHRRRRPVMIAADLARCAALASVPVAHAAGALSFAHLVAVSAVVAAGGIVFTSASGPFLKSLVPPAALLRANARFETTMWTATAVGPPLGGAAVGLLGPVTTVVLDAASHLLSALGLTRIRAAEPAPPARAPGRPSIRAGWRHIAGDPVLFRLFLNTNLVGGLIMATSPLLMVLLVGELGFAPWMYGLALGVPCLGGLLGARLSPGLVARFGAPRVLAVSGVVRAGWLVWLAFVPAGAAGVVVVVVVEFGLITSMGVFNPVFATHRMTRTPTDRLARVLSAWTITSRTTIAALTVLWGVLASVTGARAGIAIAGVLLLATPLLLPRTNPAEKPVSLPER